MSSKNLNSIISLLLELASGNLEARGKVSSRNDDYDAIIAGINILTEELKQTTVSKDYLASIYKGIADMLFVLDKNENISILNQASLDSLNIIESTTIGKPFRKLVNDPGKLKGILSKIKQQGFYYDLELEFTRSDKSIIPVNCTATLLKDSKLKVIGYLIIAKDISKIKKTEEDLKLKNKELDTFLYKAAHDLKSPITSIQGLLNIAKMEVTDSSSLKYFELIRQCANKLDYILNTLKDTVEMDIKNTVLNKISILSLLDEVLENMHHSAFFDPTVKVKKTIHQPYPIYTKSKPLIFAINQLLVNAYKFQKSNGDGKIEIKVSQQNGITYISIIDNGIGIQKKYQDNIFDMFYKANNKYEGSGLGLYSAQSIIAKIGGKIEFTSAINKGSTFVISFKNNYSDILI